MHQRRIFESCLLITVIVQIALCQQRLCFFSSVRSWRWRSRVSIFHFNRRGLVLRHRKIVFLKIRITFLTKKKDQNYKIKAGWKRGKVKKSLKKKKFMPRCYCCCCTSCNIPVLTLDLQWDTFPFLFKIFHSCQNSDFFWKYTLPARTLVFAATCFGVNLNFSWSSGSLWL